MTKILATLAGAGAIALVALASVTTTASARHWGPDIAIDVGPGYYDYGPYAYGPPARFHRHHVWLGYQPPTNRCENGPTRGHSFAGGD
jgi:hypothetical protein